MLTKSHNSKLDIDFTENYCSVLTKCCNSKGCIRTCVITCPRTDCLHTKCVSSLRFQSIDITQHQFTSSRVRGIISYLHIITIGLGAMFGLYSKRLCESPIKTRCPL